MLLRHLKQNRHGFTLVELMIVIAVIGLLATIAVPQFFSYRLRSYNTAAKAVVHILEADQSNLMNELGVYGHTERVPQTLTAPDSGVDTADSGTFVMHSLAATPLRPGARIVGITWDGTRSMAIGISIGHSMSADSWDMNRPNDESSTYNLITRHRKGDTAYGLDVDVENVMYSVSNPNWPDNPGVQANFVAPTLPAADDFLGAPGGGLPSDSWLPIR